MEPQRPGPVRPLAIYRPSPVKAQPSRTLSTERSPVAGPSSPTKAKASGSQRRVKFYGACEVIPSDVFQSGKKSRHASSWAAGPCKAASAAAAAAAAASASTGGSAQNAPPAAPRRGSAEAALAVLTTNPCPIGVDMRSVQVPLSPLDWVGPRTKGAFLKVMHDLSPVNTGATGAGAHLFGAPERSAVADASAGSSPRRKEVRRRYSTNQDYILSGKGEAAYGGGGSLRSVSSEPGLGSSVRRARSLPPQSKKGWSSKAAQYGDSDEESVGDSFIPNRQRMVTLRFPALVSRAEAAMQRRPSKDVGRPLKGCLKAAPYGSASAPSSTTNTRAPSPLLAFDVQALTMRNTREAALLHCPRTSANGAVNGPWVVPRRRDSQSKGGTTSVERTSSIDGRRVVAPRPVMKPLSFEPGFPPVGSPPRDLVDSRRLSNSSQASTSRQEHKRALDLPPIVSPKEELGSLVLVDPLPPCTRAPDREKVASPPPVSKSALSNLPSRPSPKAPLQQPRRPSLIGLGSSKVMAKLAGLRSSSSEKQSGSALQSEEETSRTAHWPDGGLLAIRRNCACRNCEPKIALSVRDGEHLIG